MKRLLIFAATASLLALPAMADLGDYTGNSYQFVTYNNGTHGMHGYAGPEDSDPPWWQTITLGANVTDFTLRNGDCFYSNGMDVASDTGNLIKHSDGTDSGIDYEGHVIGSQWMNPHPDFVDMKGAALTNGTPAYTVFVNAGNNVLGDYSNHSCYASGRPDDNTVEVTFSGFSVGHRVDIAFICTAHPDARSSAAVAKYTLTGVDSFVNDSVLSPQFDNGGEWRVPFSDYSFITTQQYDEVVDAYYAMDTASNYTLLSGLQDDMALFTDIDPGPDGTFTVTVALALGGSIQNGWDNYMNAESGGGMFDGFVLGLQSSGGGGTAPIVVNYGATLVDHESATLNGNLTTTGELPTEVIVYWDTVDRGTAKEAWANTNAFGIQGNGLKTHGLTGLLPSTQYFYRFYATNSAGVSWGSPSATFTTVGPPLPPTIVNLPAAPVDFRSATLNGNLTSTGNLATLVYVYWDTADHGSTNDAWGNTDIFSGIQATGTKSNNITGLTQNSEYFYRFFATNSAGVAWGTPTMSFTTDPASVPVITNFAATSVEPNSATANAELTSDGDLPCQVFVFWDTADRGTNGTWANSKMLRGTHTNGAKSASISGLSPETQYFYRFFATNAFGCSWGSPAIMFSTLAAPSGSGLDAYTGNYYEFVCYNNGTFGMHNYSPPEDSNPPWWEFITLGTNVTDFTLRNGDIMYSNGIQVIADMGNLIRHDDGTDSGIDYEAHVLGEQWLAPHPDYSDMKGTALSNGTPAYTVFVDTEGNNVLGDYSNHSCYASGRPDDNTVNLTFSGFAEGARVDIAFICTAHPDARSSAAVSKYILTDAESFTNQSVLSPQFDDGGSWRVPFSDYSWITTQQYDEVVGGYYGMGQASNYTYLSGLYDDMVLFTDIDPGTNGQFGITVELALGGSIQNGWDDYINAESGGGMFDGFVLGLRGTPSQNGAIVILR
jgi:hypothetical protein